MYTVEFKFFLPLPNLLNEPRFTYPVHETATKSIKKIKGKIRQTNIPIHHFELLRGKCFNDKKSEYYIELLKNKLKVYPKAKFYFELALELENLNNHREAKKYFGKAVELNPYYKKLAPIYILF